MKNLADFRDRVQSVDYGSWEVLNAPPGQESDANNLNLLDFFEFCSIYDPFLRTASFKHPVAVGEFGHVCVMLLSGPPTWQAFWAPHLVIMPNPMVLIHYSFIYIRLSWHKSQVSHRFIVLESKCSSSRLGMVGGFLLHDLHCQKSCKNKKSQYY